MRAALILVSGLLLGACAVAPDPVSQSKAVSQAEQLLGKTIPEIAEALASGSVSSVELVKAYQKRIAEIDRSGPTLNSVLALNPDAVADAKKLDELKASGKSTGPLHGVPILIKDNIETTGRLPTTAGSTALAKNITNRDSPLVSGLRSAGAVILGKANLSQWANFRSSVSLSGWSALGGQVRNPHILDRSPCGSSSGSGAAVAAALTAGAVGTETNGSIICPSNVNGIVGFKPTVGLISTKHIVPISSSQDTAGPMTRSVMGAAMMLDAMSHQSGDSPFANAVTNATLSGARLGVLRYAQGGQPKIVEKFEEALRALEAAGATLVDINKAPDRPANFRSDARLVLDTEFKHLINLYLASTPALVEARTLSDLIATNNTYKAQELVLFGQDIFEQANKASSINDPIYINALHSLRQATRGDGIDALLKENDLDALVYPSGPLSPPRDLINGDVWPEWVGDGVSAAVAGYPHLTVPMGTIMRVPIGLSFMASAGGDAKVLALGHAFEKATHLREEPQFLPNANAIDRLKNATEPATPP